jgi:hypothetical protein
MYLSGEAAYAGGEEAHCTSPLSLGEIERVRNCPD